MQFPQRNICPFCLKDVVATATWCGVCGRDLLSNKQYPYEIPPKVEPYEIVSDDEMFGIALRGEIKIHGIENIVSAQCILTALNCRLEFKKLDK